MAAAAAAALLAAVVAVVVVVLAAWMTASPEGQRWGVVGAKKWIDSSWGRGGGGGLGTHRASSCCFLSGVAIDKNKRSCCCFVLCTLLKVEMAVQGNNVSDKFYVREEYRHARNMNKQAWFYVSYAVFFSVVEYNY